MRRFFIEPPATPHGTEIKLDQNESRHITKVLRLKTGTAIELYDGTGFLYQGSIKNIAKSVTISIHSKIFFEQPQPKIILHAGLLRTKKMEMVFQKATELGVAQIFPFTSDHTSAMQPNAKKMNRYRKIIQESCKQCERIHPMEIFPPTPLQDQLTTTQDCSQRYLFWEREQQNDPSHIGRLNPTEAIHVFTGPEGGFSSKEISNLPQNVKTISLGQQILRAETAIIAGLSIVAYLAGRFKA